MNTSKLFHTVVVLGMALAAESAACSSTTSPTPTGDAGSSGTATSGGTSGAVADSGTSGNVADSGAIADASGSDAFAGWFCCG